MRPKRAPSGKNLAAEAEFYGAMDGASRFTQRDAVASIMITSINIIAGFLIGVFQHGMELRHALETYTVLTIGDGLVTVIPALMISVSGGLIVTRTGSEESLGAEFQKQVLGSAHPILLAAGVLTALAALPGLPTIPFLLLGGGLGAVGWRMRQKSVTATAVSTAAAKPKENLDALLKVESLSVEVGLGLVGIVERGEHSPLLLRVTGIRRQLATQLGYLLPPVKVKDNIALRSREYVIQMRGNEIGRFELLQGHELAIPSGNPDKTLQGKPAQDPAFGLPAMWIRTDQADRARASGYTVVDSVSVIGTHLSELAKRHAHELFSRQDAKTFCDRVAQDNPKVVEDLVPKLLPLATVQRVIQNLLRERVPIRDCREHSGIAGRSRAEQQESGAADRICPPVYPPGHRAAAAQRPGRNSRVPSGSPHRARSGGRHRTWRAEQRVDHAARDDARHGGAHWRERSKNRIRGADCERGLAAISCARSWSRRSPT